MATIVHTQVYNLVNTKTKQKILISCFLNSYPEQKPNMYVPFASEKGAGVICLAL